MQNRRKFLVQTGLATTVLIAARPFQSIASVNKHLGPLLSGGNSFTILHTGDICSKLNPIPSFGGLGGFHQTAEMIAALKSSTKNNILLDAGNVFSGKKSDQDADRETLQMMRTLGYDAMLPGQRDLKAGTGYFTEQLKNFSVPVVVSNYDINDSTLESLVNQYKVVKKGNLRIGIIAAGNATAADNINYKNPVKEINRLASILKHDERCNLIVCLSQLGFKHRKMIDDISLAKQTEYVDVVIGANSRRFMQQPLIILNKKSKEVVINHAGHSGIVLGQIEFGFDDNNQKNRIAFTNRMIGSGTSWKELS